jgi:flagellar hook-associated protein 1 FlgK
VNVGSGATLPLTAEGLSLSPRSGWPADGDFFLFGPFGSLASNVKTLMTDPKQLALANPVATSAAQTNASHTEIGPAKIVSGLPLDPNLTATVSITFTSSTQYTISGLGIGTLTNQTYTSGAPISYNGWEVKLTGSPANGDSFTIKGSSGAFGDGSNANVLGSLLQGKNFVGNSQSLADLYANMQSNIGNKADLAQTMAKSDSSVLGIASNQRESYSGVNLDQEAADLARWQQIYAANAQVLSIAQKLFENLMQQLG